jgi:hypothetical protein
MRDGRLQVIKHLLIFGEPGVILWIVDHLRWLVHRLGDFLRLTTEGSCSS